MKVEAKSGSRGSFSNQENTSAEKGPQTEKDV